ncbi:MAG: MaoC/PaaZ C-terminal domain-containing protein [Bacillota bacterium]
MAKALYFEDVQVGTEMPTLVKPPVAPQQLVKYSGASGDFNQLHTVDAVGKEAGFGGVIAHGMLIMGFVGQAVTDWIPRKNLKKFGVRFASPTKPGTVITVTGKVLDKRVENGENLISGELFATDQDGQVKIAGSFEAALPTKG